ncbi:hypothetical protein T439DRAFT_325824 [Meredithblackwellia eburnea MCA 4105]
MVATAASAGPDVTRNHYFHDFFPTKLAYASCDDERPNAPYSARPKMVSQQAPRKVRLAQEAKEKERLDRLAQLEKSTAASKVATSPVKAIPIAIPPASFLSTPAVADIDLATISTSPIASTLLKSPSSSSPLIIPPPSSLSQPSAAASNGSTRAPVTVQCQVRTRIPTPHGHVFLHLYKNTHDEKEHLAFVADHAQLDARPTDPAPPASRPYLRSTSLDAEWKAGETDMERIIRGAYVGRLSVDTITPSTAPATPVLSSPPTPSLSSPTSPLHPTSSIPTVAKEPPLVRIHSECFTGEVIGSQRCDCGEQLDEAFRLITLQGRGVIVYLRQEGRGIGLLEKLRAYNLQDLGHDTVAANLLLGHGADQRTYDIAGAILRDLEIGEVRLLTNNPDKISKIEEEGVRVVQRVAMVPRSWTQPVGTMKKKGARKVKRSGMSGVALLEQALMSSTEQAHFHSHPHHSHPHHHSDEVERDLSAASSDVESGHASEEDDDQEEEEEEGDGYDSDASHTARRGGVGMIGAGVTRSAELEKYLRTKIERMGHMLDIPPTPPAPPVSRAESPLGVRRKLKEEHEKMKETRRREESNGSSSYHPLMNSVGSLQDEI